MLIAVTFSKMDLLCWIYYVTNVAKICNRQISSGIYFLWGHNGQIFFLWELKAETQNEPKAPFNAQILPLFTVWMQQAYTQLGCLF